MKYTKQPIKIGAVTFPVMAVLVFIHSAVYCQGKTGAIRDKDGNTYTVKIFPDHKKWMTDNLKINIPGSYCYEDATQNCDKYGRLYAWASAQQGCALLGKGWRLPTNEEWQQMARWYGGVEGDSADSGKTAFKMLLTGGQSGFNARLGGGRGLDDKYGRLNAHGFYWTATEIDTGNAWFLNFGKGSGKLFDQKDGEKPRAFSVRCVCEIIKP